MPLANLSLELPCSSARDTSMWSRSGLWTVGSRFRQWTPRTFRARCMAPNSAWSQVETNPVTARAAERPWGPEKAAPAKSMCGEAHLDKIANSGKIGQPLWRISNQGAGITDVTRAALKSTAYSNWPVIPILSALERARLQPNSCFTGNLHCKPTCETKNKILRYSLEQGSLCNQETSQKALWR